MGVSPTEEMESGTSVAWVASAEETKRMEPTDKTIFGMVSESLGRNEGERTGDPETLYLRGRAPVDRAKAAWNVANWPKRRDTLAGR